MYKRFLNLLQLTKDSPIALQAINLKHVSFLYTHTHTHARTHGETNVLPLNNADIYYHSVSVEGIKNYMISTCQHF